MGVLVQHSGHDVLLAAAFTAERDAPYVIVVGHAESEIKIGNSIIKLHTVLEVLVLFFTTIFRQSIVKASIIAIVHR